MHVSKNSKSPPPSFFSTLREKGLRPTKQRNCVFRVINEKQDHPTADDIFVRVRRRLPTISFATVYNCLETLVGCGLVRQVNIDREPARYCSNLNPHAHFKCIKTGKIFDLPLDDLVLSKIASIVPRGFNADHFDLSFSGTITDLN